MNSKLPEEDIFHEARQLESNEARSAFVEERCGGNLHLQRRIEAMLEVHFNEPDYLDLTEQSHDFRTYRGDSPRGDSAVQEQLGDLIGPYLLREQLGEGGMGVVYVAEQSAPVSRKVAIKVIKPGMDSKQVIARFEAERQALAMMDHPNIARVLDAGTTDSGRPYFAMDLVRGLPITDYCKMHRLSTRAVIALFIDVCLAVQHAHQKGIIHRDLKPSNVLVTRMGDRAVVKIIDFGLAKAMQFRLTDKTIYTNLFQLVGTPLYMSPEQTEMSAYEVDTRSDVYSLGVMLYELLTGETPIERSRLSSLGYDDIRKIVREEVPKKPSDRVSTIAERHDPTLDDDRRIELIKTKQLLRGELDWITLKSLEKDAQRRYQSASDLADELQRFLSGDTVEACPPSLGYRIRKTIRRHRVAALTASLVIVSMIAGTITSLIYANRARLAVDDANAARQTAQTEEARARGFAAQRDAASRKQRREADRAIAAERRQRELREQAEKAKYRYSIRLAQSLLDRGDDATALSTLEKLMPLPGRPYQPGWAWRYLLGSAESSELSWQAHDFGNSLLWVDHGSKIFSSGKALNSLNRQARLWNASSGELIGNFDDWKRGQPDWNPETNSIGIIAGKEYQILSLGNGTVRTQQQPVMAYDPTSTLWNPKGTAFAAKTSEGIGFWSWDGQQAQPIATLPQQGTGKHCGWNANGDLFATTTGPGRSELRVYDWPDLNEKCRIPLKTPDQPESVSVGFWHPQSNQIAVRFFEDSGLAIVDVDHEQVLSRIFSRRESLFHLAWSPDGRWLAGCCSSGKVYVWESESFEEIVVFDANDTFTKRLAWAPDSTKIACLGIDGTIGIWSIVDNSAASGSTQTLDVSATRFVWSDSDSMRFCSKKGDVCSISLQDQTSRTIVDGKPQSPWVLLANDFAVRSVAQGANSFAEYRRLSRGESQFIRNLPLVTGVPLMWAVSHDFDRMAIRHAKIAGRPVGFQSPHLIDLKTGAIAKVPLGSISSYKPDQQMAFSADGTRLAIAGKGPNEDVNKRNGAPGVSIFDVTTGQIVYRRLFAELGDADAAMRAVEWCSDEKSLIVTAADGREFQVDIESNRILGSIRTHTSAVPDLALHPTDPLVASGGKSKVAIWDLDSFEVLLEFPLDGSVKQIDWSPDGTRLAALDNEGSIHVWDCRPGLDFEASKYFTALRSEAYAAGANAALLEAESHAGKMDFETASRTLQPWVEPDGRFHREWIPTKALDLYKEYVRRTEIAPQ